MLLSCYFLIALWGELILEENSGGGGFAKGGGGFANSGGGFARAGGGGGFASSKPNSKGGFVGDVAKSGKFFETAFRFYRCYFGGSNFAQVGRL